jgi:hypothetical protein
MAVNSGGECTARSIVWRCEVCGRCDDGHARANCIRVPSRCSCATLHPFGALLLYAAASRCQYHSRCSVVAPRPIADACCRPLVCFFGRICSSSGLRNKREVYRVNYTLSKVRSVARHLLTLPEKVRQPFLSQTARRCSGTACGASALATCSL